jgi:S1-C subfamily serine protease
MSRWNQPLMFLVLALGLIAHPSLVPSARADEAENIRKMYDLAKPSLVAVKYSWVNELRTQEITVAGVVVGSDGLVVVPLEIMAPSLFPGEQLQDFKIIVPSDTDDYAEIDATLQGRDERANLAYVKTNDPQKWKALTFVDATPQIGDRIYSVGLLPKGAGYKTHVTSANFSLMLRGPVPQALVDGNLAGSGSIAINSAAQVIGLVHGRSLGEALLDNPENPDDLPMVNTPPHVFIPASDFLDSLAHPPTPDHPIAMPWVGAKMKGLEKEYAEYFGLVNTPAVQLGEVIADSPAAKAGLKPLDVIVKVNGKPIQRGDLPEELPEIVTRQVQHMDPGQKVVFSVIQHKGDVPKDIEVTLEPRPREPNEAKRYYAKDLGFVAREVTFYDAYTRKLPAGTPGVVIALLRPQAAAQAAKLEVNELVTQMNGKPVTTLDQFKTDYQQFRKDRPNDPVVLEVSQPDGKEQTINIEPPQNNVQPGENGGF